jgi:hypothetical protein
VYAIKDAELVVLALRVAHRRDVYRNFWRPQSRAERHTRREESS